MVLDATKNRLGDAAKVKLVVTAQPRVASQHAPSNTRCQKFRADLIISRRIDGPEQICRLDCEFEAARIKFSCRKFCAWALRSAERLQARKKKRGNDGSTKRFHSARLP